MAEERGRVFSAYIDADDRSDITTPGKTLSIFLAHVPATAYSIQTTDIIVVTDFYLSVAAAA